MKGYSTASKIRLIIIGVGVLILTSCGNAPIAIEAAPSLITPVQITTIADSSITEYIEFPAVSAYLEKSFVKANMNGYVKKSTIKLGQKVERGEFLFSVISKEARSIGSAINKLDSSFNFTGISSIKAGAPGIIIQVNHQNGDYVQDGEAMATISNRNSLVFLLDVPYVFNQLVSTNRNMEIKLPDGKTLLGSVSGTMPSVDSLAQTQRFILKVVALEGLPEGLIGSVKLTKLFHPLAQILPKNAILSNETADEFWVMKLINDSTAVKIRVNKGIEGKNTTEVMSPKFLKTDRIIITGNYGLADTARVKIQK